MKKRISEMSDDEKRVAIAEACGWKFVAIRNDFARRLLGVPPTASGLLHEVPYYLTSLDAMHEAENACINEDNFETYEFHLDQVVAEDDGRGAICATASQRAQAFLLTIGHQP